MRKFLIVFSLFFLLSQFPRCIYAVPSPEQVEEVKNQAQYIVTGEVKSVYINKDKNKSSFDLLITKGERMSGSIQPGVLVKVAFSYRPEELIEPGSSRVNVYRGETIKIWMNQKDVNLYESAIAGDTIEIINYSLSQRLFSKIGPNIQTIFTMLVILIVIVVTIWTVNKRKK